MEIYLLQRGGGGRILMNYNGTLLFLREIYLSFFFLEKLIGGSHEKIIRFFFLYEILKESIFFKKIFSLRKYRKFMGKFVFNY